MNPNDQKAFYKIAMQLIIFIYKCCSHRRRAGEFANVNQEHQAWSDHVGGEINGRFRFVSDLGRFACATVDQVDSCSKLSTLLKTTICSQQVDSVDIKLCLQLKPNETLTISPMSSSKSNKNKLKGVTVHATYSS